MNSLVRTAWLLAIGAVLVAAGLFFPAPLQGQEGASADAPDGKALFAGTVCSVTVPRELRRVPSSGHCSE